MNYPNEILPKINWNNQNTENIVAVFMVVDGVVTEIFTNTQATGTQTIKSSENGDGWTGLAEFNINNLNFDLSEYHTYQIFGKFHVDNTGESAEHMLWGASTSDSFDFKADGSYGGLSAEISSNYNRQLFSIAPTDDVFTSLSWRVKQVGNKVYGDIYTEGNLSTSTTTPHSSNSNLRNIIKIGKAWGGQELNLVIVYKGKVDPEQLAAVDINPFDLFQKQEDVNNEYGLKLSAISESISIPFIGAWSGLLIDTDGAETIISGTGTYSLTGTTEIFIRTIEVTDTTGYNYFEFNQETGMTVNSQTSDLVCTLTATNDSNWQPIIPVSISTIGTGKDYSQPQLWVDSTKNLSSRQVGVLYEMFDVSTFQYGYLYASGMADYQGELRAPYSVNFNGDKDAADMVGLYGATERTKVIGSGGLLKLKNIVIKGRVNQPIDASNCYIGELLTTAQSFINNSTVTFPNGLYSKSVNINNSVIKGRFTSNNVADVLNANSCVFTDIDHRSGGTVNIFNSILAGSSEEDSSADNQYNVDMSTWFDANGQITTDGQTALAGQGWNGEDICGWANAGAEAPVSITLELESLVINSLIDTVDMIRTTALGFNSITVALDIADVDLQRYTTLASDDIAVNTTVEEPLLTRTTSLLVGGLVLPVTIDEVTLSSNAALEIDPLFVSSSLESVDISRTTSLDLSDISIPCEIEDVNIIATSLLALDALTVTTSIDDVNITRKTLLALEILNVDCSLSNVTINRQTSISIDDVYIAVQIDDVELSTNALLSVDPITITSTVDSVALTNRVTELSLSDVAVNCSIDSPQIIRNTAIVIDDISVTVFVDGVVLQANLLLNIDDISVISAIDHVSISRETTLSVEDINVPTTISEVSLSSNGLLVIHALNVTPHLSTVDLQRQTNLTLHDLSISCAIDPVEITRAVSLFIDNLSVSAHIDQADILRKTTLAVSNIFIDSAISTVDLLGEFELLLDGISITCSLTHAHLHLDPFTNTPIDDDIFITVFKTESFLLENVNLT